MPGTDAGDTLLGVPLDAVCRKGDCRHCHVTSNSARADHSGSPNYFCEYILSYVGVNKYDYVQNLGNWTFTPNVTVPNAVKGHYRP